MTLKGQILKNRFNGLYLQEKLIDSHFHAVYGI